MTNGPDNRMMILLLEQDGCGNEVDRWLGDNGFVAWKAKDVCHAIEDLSDFTVRRRPDIVMLEVPSLFRRFDALTNTFQECSDNVRVCGYAPGTSRGHEGFVSDLDQLKSLLSRRVWPSNN